MGSRWNPIGFQFFCFLVLIIGLFIQESFSLNSDGLALLEFRGRIHSDPHGAFANWNPNDTDPCFWFGVQCVDGKVHILDLTAFSLEGTLAPELAKLSQLRSLVLKKNHFCGSVPKEFGELRKLKLLDLRDNNLTGLIPGEIRRMLPLNCLLLHDNEFEGSISRGTGRVILLSKLQFREKFKSRLRTRMSCIRKFGHCILQRSWEKPNKAASFLVSVKGALMHYLDVLPFSLFKLRKDSFTEHENDCCGSMTGFPEQYVVHNVRTIVQIVRRRMLEDSRNLPATPIVSGSSSQLISSVPITHSSGSFLAVQNATRNPSPPLPSLPLTPDPPVAKPTPPDGQSSQQKRPSDPRKLWKYLTIAPCVVVLIALVAIFCICGKRASKSIGPWRTGLSGQLQKAFVTGVPKLNSSELEIACEDFSNIIDTLEDCTVYKGTLSSGVEIAVASTATASLKDWSNNSELAYRRKIETLSRINHKNFVNLIGYCEEDEPFHRKMVFEYAPNGTLFEHLHIKEMEHLDWNVRMRIVMGVAYCLQYMHHDLNPAIGHTNLSSTAIYLTDDYAAKLAEINFGPKAATKLQPNDDENEDSELLPVINPEANIYAFGLLLLEIISGKLPYSEDGHLRTWADQYLNDRRSISDMIDPTLKSLKNDELDVVCEVIKECIQPEARQRPTMKNIVPKLRQVISISPEQATPRLSPLWWAELEILSMEAT